MLMVHDVYRRLPHHAQVMAPSKQALLVAKFTKTKANKMRSEWVEAVANIHTYIYHTLKSIGTRRHGTSGSLCICVLRGGI